MRLQCLVHGHQDLWNREPRRVFLRCAECGRETPGWTLDLPAPRQRFADVARVLRGCDSITALQRYEGPDRADERRRAPALATASVWGAGREERIEA